MIYYFVGVLVSWFVGGFIIGRHTVAMTVGDAGLYAWFVFALGIIWPVVLPCGLLVAAGVWSAGKFK